MQERPRSFRRCGACREHAAITGAKFERRLYCGKSCADADWKLGHKQFHVDLKQKWRRLVEMDEEEEKEEEVEELEELMKESSVDEKMD